MEGRRRLPRPHHLGACLVRFFFRCKYQMLWCMLACAVMESTPTHPLRGERAVLFAGGDRVLQAPAASATAQSACVVAACLRFPAQHGTVYVVVISTVMIVGSKGLFFGMTSC